MVIAAVSLEYTQEHYYNFVDTTSIKISVSLMKFLSRKRRYPWLKTLHYIITYPVKPTRSLLGTKAAKKTAPTQDNYDKPWIKCRRDRWKFAFLEDENFMSEFLELRPK